MGDLVDGSAIRDFRVSASSSSPVHGCTRLHSDAISSPSAPAVVAENRRLFKAAIRARNPLISRSALWWSCPGGSSRAVAISFAAISS